ncbi:hypothetical protein GCM10022231_20300 [Gordonia caeni]|uniref:DUF5642 domain-containing protein n=1 Tax=Gordonia caeni TaxID=1007097 RepID=A0ABP7P622_9ACTN
MVAVVAVALLAAGCSVSGTGQPVPDYTSLLVPGDSYPNGPGVQVPGPQVPGAVADITLRPLSGDVAPAECTPAAVDTETAAVMVGPGPAPGSTLTEMVVRTGESVSSLAAAARECPVFTSGATGTQEVRTQVTGEPRSDGGVERLRLTRTLTTAGSETAVVLEQWVAQRGSTRVVVQVRSMAPVGEAERQRAEEFFTAAIDRAFGDGN